MKVFTFIVVVLALGAWLAETLGWLKHRHPNPKPPPDAPAPPPHLWRE